MGSFGVSLKCTRSKVTLFSFSVLMRNLKHLQLQNPAVLLGPECFQRTDRAERKRCLWSLTASRSVNQVNPPLMWAGHDFSSFNRDGALNSTSVARLSEHKFA